MEEISKLKRQHNAQISQMREFQNNKDNEHVSLNVFHNNDH